MADHFTSVYIGNKLVALLIHSEIRERSERDRVVVRASSRYRSSSEIESRRRV